MTAWKRGCLLAALTCGFAGLGGCTSLLGDFSVGDAGSDDGSTDATVDSTTGSEGGDTSAPDGPDGGPLNEAGTDADGGGGCTPGATCTPAEACKTGLETCDGGVLSCTASGNAMQGSSCDAGAVCSNGACVACAVGADCSDAGSCEQWSVVCATGAPVCTDMGAAMNGKACGANLYCNAGACKACTNGAPCAPAGAPCHAGTFTCTGGNAVCNDTGNPANAGTPCGMNMVCNGGTCMNCTAGTACNPGGDKCKAGVTTCATGTQTCMGTGDAPNGTQCGSGANEVCTGGVCGCKPGTSTCGGNCVDLTSDPANCGTCGKGCVYGGCASSKCQPWTVGYFGGSEFATDGNYVVFDNGLSAINEIKASGGSVIASPTSGLLMQIASGPVMANGTVAWLGSGINVYGAPEGSSNGAVKASFPSGFTPTYLAINPQAASVFILGQSSVANWEVYLFACALNGTSCYKVTSNYIEYPGAAGYQTQFLQVNTNYAFWTFGLPPSSWSVGTYDFGTNIQSNTPTNGSASYLTLDAANVYWAANPAYTVYRAAQNNVGSPLGITSVATPIYGLASDGTNVYIGTRSPNPSGAAVLYYVPVAGGTPQALYTSMFTVQSHIGPIHTAGGAVYFADTDETTCPANPYLRAIAAP
jgi:hypothetical protein